MRLPIAFYSSRDFGTIIGEPVVLGRPFFATSAEYEKVLPKIKEYYETLLEKGRKGKLRKGLDEFFQKISSIAILDASFKTCLSKELGLREEYIEQVFLSTNYVRRHLDYLKQNFRKIKKEDPVKYAEGFGELVAILGFKKALNLLNRKGLKIGASTLRCLYKVSMMPISVKKLIKEGKIPLTVAFELPLDSTEEVAKEVAGLSYHEAIKLIRSKYRR